MGDPQAAEPFYGFYQLPGNVSSIEDEIKAIVREL
jgi:hypothetical protein